MIAAIPEKPPSYANQVKSVVSEMLKDSESARWYLPSERNSVVYCGWFNAKNSYGGFAGWTAFYIKIQKGIPQMDTIEVEDKNEYIGEPIVAMSCRVHGYTKK
jgi:hypothetical protein